MQDAVVKIRRVEKADLLEWLRLRVQSWPDLPLNVHRQQMAGVYENLDDDYVVFVANAGFGHLAGFLEGSVQDYFREGVNVRLLVVEGCRIDEDFDHVAMLTSLHQAAEHWAREKQCSEMACEASVNHPAIKSYSALGYSVVNTVVKLIKPLS